MKSVSTYRQAQDFSVGAKNNIGPSVYTDFPVCFYGLKFKNRKIILLIIIIIIIVILFLFRSAQYILSFMCV